LRRGRIADDLDPVSEPHTLDEFWQLVMAVNATPIFLRAYFFSRTRRVRRPITTVSWGQSFSGGTSGSSPIRA
jgi:hypothetical protein